MEAVNLLLLIAVHNAEVSCFDGVGGPGEIRTHDLFHAMEARSQLRHRPTAGVIQYITHTLRGTTPSLITMN